LTRFAALCLALSGAARAAAGGGLEVSPIRVDLSRSAAAAMVSLHNSSDEQLRYELKVVSWDQDQEGQMRLEPSSEVALFPQILSLQPGERRNVRLGVQPALFGPLEKTYRLLVDQLPPAPRPNGGSQVRVISRISIPVFVAPERRLARLRVEDPSVASGQARFRLVNDGNVGVRPHEIVLEAFDAGGRSVAREKWEGWYVLAASARSYSLALPGDACRKAAKLAVAVKLEDGTLSAEGKKRTEGACAP
jgi:fimbrial chaperone protein